MTLKLEVGKSYVTVNNRKVQIVHKSTIPNRLRPFLGIVSLSQTEELSGYFSETGSQSGDEKFDLVKEYVTPTYRWLPLYRQGCGRYSDTLDQAILDKTTFVNVHGTVCFIGLYRVDLNSGDLAKVEG